MKWWFLAHAAPVTIIAPRPPPVTGQSAYSLYLEDRLRIHGLETLSLPGRSDRDGWRGYANKLLCSIGVAARLALGPKRETVFIVLDGGIGLVFDFIFLLVLRVRGFGKVLLSHHSFAYIDKKSTLMSLVVRLAGKTAFHIFLCSKMNDEFQMIYGRRFQNLVVSNARRTQLNTGLGSSLAKPTHFTLGFISNISFDKGIAEYFDLIEMLLKEDHNIYGLIAGPAASDDLGLYLKERIARCGGRVEWLGPLYGDEKQAFLSRLSVLVFPTKYVNEAQPNVLFESLSHGVPTMTIARGCIDEDMTGSGSLVALSTESFLTEALPYVKTLIEHHQEGHANAASLQAASHFTSIHNASSQAEVKLVELMLSKASKN